MISPKDLCGEIIIPTLEKMAEVEPRMMSDAAVNLLLGTAAHESLCGYHLKQVKGPALGIFQIEPATHHDLYQSYINYRPQWQDFMGRWRSQNNDGDAQLVYDLRYATAVARLIYWRAPAALPDPFDVDGLAKYWDDHYNCNGKHYSQDGFLDNYDKILNATL